MTIGARLWGIAILAVVDTLEIFIWIPAARYQIRQRDEVGAGSDPIGLLH